MLKSKINSLKSNIHFPRLLCNQLCLSFARGDQNPGPSCLVLKRMVPGQFSRRAQVCSSAGCPVSGIRINIWTERKLSLPFVLGRGNSVSENISHLSKWKRTKPKSFIVRWRPAFWNIQSSAVSGPLELHRWCGKARHSHEACPRDTWLKISEGPR